jgi:hypothetical protein
MQQAACSNETERAATSGNEPMRDYLLSPVDPGGGAGVKAGAVWFSRGRFPGTNKSTAKSPRERGFSEKGAIPLGGLGRFSVFVDLRFGELAQRAVGVLFFFQRSLQ